MSISNERHEQGQVATWHVETVVALALAGIAALVITDSLRLGIGWGEEGPKSGFFPFYIGVLLLGSALVTLLQQFWARHRVDDDFVSKRGARSIAAILGPAVVFVVAVEWIGIYVATALLIAFFMRVHGGFSWLRSAALALLIAVFILLVFELWFVTPLPKGPVEGLFGL